MVDEAVLARFMAKVRVLENGCHEWTGAKIRCGYGIFALTKKRHPVAHRFIYEALVGEIPAGLVIDHVCNNRACVNPAHLRPASHRENILRGNGIASMYAARTHCKNGHELAGSNLAIGKDGYRTCRICRNKRGAEQNRAFREANRDRLNAERRERYRQGRG